MVDKALYSVQITDICFIVNSIKEGYFMTNLSIVILVLTALLVNFGAILTANIYFNSVKELQRKKLFCGKSLSNPYCIIENFTPIIHYF